MAAPHIDNSSVLRDRNYRLRSIIARTRLRPPAFAEHLDGCRGMNRHRGGRSGRARKAVRRACQPRPPAIRPGAAGAPQLSRFSSAGFMLHRERAGNREPRPLPQPVLRGPPVCAHQGDRVQRAPILDHETLVTAHAQSASSARRNRLLMWIHDRLGASAAVPARCNRPRSRGRSRRSAARSFAAASE